MKKFRTVFALLCLFAGPVVSGLQADAVVLHTGEVLFGQVQEYGEALQIVNRGAAVVIPRNAILRIYRGDQDEPQFRSRILDIASEGRSLRNNASAKTELVLADEWAIILRSAALPGWGQMYAGEKQKGYVFLGLAVATGAYFASTHLNYLAADRRYRADYRQALLLGAAAPDTLRGFRSEDAFLMTHLIADQLLLRSHAARTQAGKDRQLASAVFGLVYLANLADAAFFTPVAASYRVRPATAIAGLAIDIPF
ncbi:MAG: hypothetical protein HS115_09480 [Spirochaetales bacterium]|nr:hypothetical protein [Spirochaetales bacterium]